MQETAEPVETRDRRLGRFKLFAGLGGLVIAASVLGPERYNLTPLLPAYIGGCIAYYLARFEEFSETAKGVLFILFAVFFVREAGDIKHDVEERRLLSLVRQECSHPSVANSGQCEEIRAAIYWYLNPRDDGE